MHNEPARDHLAAGLGLMLDELARPRKLGAGKASFAIAGQRRCIPGEHGENTIYINNMYIARVRSVT